MKIVIYFETPYSTKLKIMKMLWFNDDYNIGKNVFSSRKY